MNGSINRKNLLSFISFIAAVLFFYVFPFFPASALNAKAGDSTQLKTLATQASLPISYSKASNPEAESKFHPADLLEDGALPDMVMGHQEAPIEIIEYASLTCFHCAYFKINTLPKLKKKYIDTGKVRFIFREFAFDPRAEAGFMLARCSEKNYFPMIALFFKNQEELVKTENAKEMLLKLTRQAGFSEKSFNACLSDTQLLKKIRSIRENAEKKYNINSTPTFFIQGEKYSKNLSFEEISSMIESRL